MPVGGILTVIADVSCWVVEQLLLDGWIESSP